MGLKSAGADLAYKGGLFAGTKYIGLLDTDGAELSGNGYSRTAATGFGSSGFWQADGNEYENREEVSFPEPTGAAWSPIGYWGLYSAQTGGTLLFDVDITDTTAPQIGADITSPAEGIGYAFSGLSNAGSLAALQSGLFSGTRYLTLHTGDPGATGANLIFTDGVVWDGSNQASKTAVRLQPAAADWTVDTNNNARRARNNKQLSFGVQTANLPAISWIALRDGGAYNSGVLATANFTARDPGLGDAIVLAANSLVFTIAIDS